MGLLNRKKKIEKAEEEKTSVAAENEAAPAVKEAEAQILKKGSARSNRILLKPLITEKAAIAQSLNKYSFLVARDAAKNEIKRAVKEIYGVMPQAVNVINTEGKKRRFGRAQGRRSDYRKAVVTLPAGKSITIHEGV